MAVRSCISAAGTAVVVIIVASTLFAAHAAAYPSPIQRVSEDSNYFRNALRNSPSRELDRFIDACDGDDCNRPLQLMNVAPKRSSLDRLNGGQIMAAKRDNSLDRLGGGQIMGAKRDSLDRLGGPFIFNADDCAGDVDECGGNAGASRSFVAVKRHSSLDRLSGGHVMGAKRDNSLDRLGGGYIMGAKRDSSLYRLDGRGHVMRANRIGGWSDGRWSAPRADNTGGTIDRLGKGILLARRWTGDGPFADYDDCLDCGPSAEESSF